MAANSPGFVWRLIGDGDDATSIRVSDDPLVIVNMSVWESIDALYKYAYKTHHADFFARRREWFTKWEKPSPVLWYVVAGHRPTVAEAIERIDHYAENGPTPYAFDFKRRFTVEEMLSVS